MKSTSLNAYILALINLKWYLMQNQIIQKQRSMVAK